MHYIQLHILDKLVKSRFLKNKDMRPNHVESNLYQYHLARLIKQGFLKKTEQGYTLRSKGLNYAARHSIHLKKKRVQPVILTLLFITDNKGRLVLRQKQRQPFIGQYSLIMGKLHTNETLADSASREFFEKISEKECPKFEYLGTAHLNISQEGCNITESIILMMSGQFSADTDLKDEAMPLNLNEINNWDLSPGTKELIEAYLNKQKFVEINIDLTHEIN